MKIKVFTAVTMQEAMEQVKRELGMDAVILHSKKVQKKGLLGYASKEMIEVTAAVEDTLNMAEEKRVIGEPMVPKSMLKQYLGANTHGAQNTMNRDNQIIQSKKGLQNMEQNEVGENAKDTKEERILQLQHELDHMKIMLEKVMSEASQNKARKISLFDALLENELDDKIAQEIVSSILDEAVLMNKDAPEAVEYLAAYLDQRVRPACGIKIGGNEQPRIVAMIGATGVGKTTTIAKIAAKFVLEKGCNVALITADTYRISAVEQLKTYSDIIGLPIEIVYSPAELRSAIHKHRDKDLILIDTAGRSQHNEFQLNELRELLAVESGIEKHLVLSATTKYKDAVDIIRKFSVCVPDKLLFTKVDETSCIGVIINIIHQYPITLSYLTDGQSVPDDIVVADSRKLAELILR